MQLKLILISLAVAAATPVELVARQCGGTILNCNGQTCCSPTGSVSYHIYSPIDFYFISILSTANKTVQLLRKLDNK